MKIYSTNQTYVINSLPKKQRNIVFTGNSTNGLSEDSFKKLNTAKSLFDNISFEYCDKVNLERQGTHIDKISNCLMFEVQNYGDEIFPVEWLKKTADCNFVHLSDSNNDALMDNLEEELKKSKDTFEQTKRRTLIHVEGFDRLITKGQNSFENIDSLKDIMNRSANDFGATIVFSTKDASKLTSEAIQPHRVTPFIVNNLKTDLENYNAFLESRGYFKDYEKRIATETIDVSKTEIPKGTTEVKTEITTEQVEQPKSKTEPRVQAEQQELSKSSVKPDASTPKQSETSKSKSSGFDTPPSRQSSASKSSITTDSPSKAPDVPSSIKKTAEKSSDGPKAFKVVAILSAIGIAIAGAIYFMKNKNKTQEVKENSNQPNSNIVKNSA